MMPDLARRFFALLACLLVCASATTQSTWLDVSSLGSPPARSYHCMAHDEDRQVTVLFGGMDGTRKLSDTWEWDGYLWTERKTTGGPPARQEGVLCYAGPNRGVLLFGGSDTTRLSDCWTFDGKAWQRVLSTTTPTNPAGWTTIAYDSHRGVVVLVTGGGSGLWEWDGRDWTEKKVGTPRPGLSGTAMAYDARRRQTVFVGLSAPNVTETWLWNGMLWTQANPGRVPPGYGPAIYDSARGVVVFSSPYPTSSHSLDDLYEWDGQDWTPVWPTNQPLFRYGEAMAYDSARHRLVMFGGIYNSSRGDTWELVHDCFCVGKGHPGGGLPLNCVAAPVLGTTFVLAFGAPQGTGLLFVGPVPITGVALGPPILCRPGTLFTSPLAVLPGTGRPALVTWPIGSDARLIGCRVTLQAASPTSTGCFELTDAVEVAVRARR